MAMPRPSSDRGVLASAAVALAGLLAGCGPSVPANPTYEQHVRPILEARCLRCHSNPINLDLARPDTSMPHYSLDIRTEAELQLQTNMAVYTFIKASYAYAKGTVNPPGIMPPPPAAPLEDWQIETLERWSQAQPP
jgi:hypothetical protein